MKKAVTLLLLAGISMLAAVPAQAADPASAETKAPAPVAAPAIPAPPAAGTPLAGPRLTPETPSTTAAATRIGYVDMARIASDSAPGKAATAEMKAKSSRLGIQLQSKEKQLSKQKSALEAAMPSLSQSQREAKAKEFQKKIADFQKFAQKAEKDFQSRQAQLLSNLFEATQKAAVEYAKANGLAAVVIKKDLLYVGDNVEAKDLTDEIIKVLDRKAPAKK